jgi:hypothetical protein
MCLMDFADSCLCFADESNPNPESSPFLQLMIQYMQRTSPNADRSMAAAERNHVQWQSKEAVNVLSEQYSSCRSAKLWQLSKLANTSPDSIQLEASAGAALQVITLPIL